MNWLLGLDRAVLGWFVSLPESPALDGVMLALSGFGFRGIGFIALAVVAALRWRGLRVMAAWRVVLAVVLAVIASDVIVKPLVGRERPFEGPAAVRTVGPHAHGKSFPSGHATAAVAGAYALSLLWRTRRRAWWTLAVLVCVSRVYLGVHYPLDVIGGALLGWACAYFATAASRPVAPELPAPAVVQPA